MENAAVDPTLTIILAIIGMLGLTIGPIGVALVNRGGKAKPLDLDHLPPDVVMPRAQYDALFEQFARADDENERLVRENHHLREELNEARAEAERLRRRKGAP